MSDTAPAIFAPISFLGPAAFALAAPPKAIAAEVLAIPRGLRAIGAVNVSGEFADLEAEDQVYRTEDGYLVKIKILWLGRQSGPGAERFQVSGSIVGRDGKALRRPCGAPAVYSLGQTAGIGADALHDPEVGLEIARLQCVRETLAAHKHEQALLAYRPGMTSRDAFDARKAAEAQAEAEGRA